jgi:hypothetical protein
MALAGQRDRARWSWPRALASFALFCALLVGLNLVIDGEPGGIVGGGAVSAWAIATARQLHLRHRAEVEGTSPPPRFTRLHLAVAVISVIALIAVVAISVREPRDREQMVARALGAEEVSEADELRIERFFETLETFSAQHQEAVVTIGDTELPVGEHRAAVDRLSGTVEELHASAAAVSDAEVKKTLTGYMRRVQNLDHALDNWVETEEYGDADERAFDVALAEVESASLSMQKADEDLRARLAAEMTPEERERFLEGTRRREREFEEATGG